MGNKNRTDLFSNKIRIFSFLLTILVIWIHSVRPDLIFAEDPEGTARLVRLQELLGSVFGQIAVPGFFALSGYLFFRNAGGLQEAGTGAAGEFFAGKLRSRVRTLVLPYLLWNLIYYVIYLIFGKAELSLWAAAEALLLYRYNPVFWYLKQLILLTVLTPLIWILLNRRAKAAFVLPLLLAGAVFYQKLPLHIVNEDALFYYSAGAAAALHNRAKIEAVPDPKKKRDPYPFLWGLSLYLFLQAAGNYGLYYGHEMLWLFGTVCCRICGAAALWMLLGLIRAGERETPVYMEYNFYTYATHYLELRLVQLLAGLPGETAWTAMALYLVMPALCIALSVTTGRMMQKRLPKLFALLTGGRV